MEACIPELNQSLDISFKKNQYCLCSLYGTVGDTQEISEKSFHPEDILRMKLCLQINHLRKNTVVTA